jgi:hypothetical protein
MNCTRSRYNPRWRRDVFARVENVALYRGEKKPAERFRRHTGSRDDRASDEGGDR